MGVIKEGMEAWKAAWSSKDPGDVLSHMDYLLSEWQESEIIVEFENPWQIIIASLFLTDGILPLQARKGLANTILNTIGECSEKRFKVDSLKIKPDKPGRKKDSETQWNMLHQTHSLIKEGLPKQESYELVAKKFHKSPDTVRRAYERAIKRRANKPTGKISD